MSRSCAAFYDCDNPELATQRKLGGGYRCGFGGGGGSSASTSTTNNLDKRLVVSSGAGVSADNSTVSLNVLDGGAVKDALSFASSASKDAATGFGNLLNTSSQSFDGLISLAKTALSGGFQSLGQSQANAAAFVDTVNSKGTLDNRTITILGVSAAAALALFAWRK